MGLTKDEFFQAWIDAKESQEPYIIETAWKRYEQTQQPDYKSTSKSNGPTAEQFQASLDPFLSDANVAGHIEKSKFISIPADVAPWRATGLVLEHGQKVSVFNTGRVWRSKLLDLSLGPQWVCDLQPVGRIIRDDSRHSRPSSLFLDSVRDILIRLIALA